jgi:MOSC domain-containing protein YiiM
MITVRHAMLADYAMVSQEGKLSIIGIFEKLYAQKSPVTHPMMSLVMNFEADRADAGKQHRLEFQLIDADGTVQLNFGGDMKVAPPPPGENARFNHIVNMNNVVFKEFGSYEFKVLVNGEVRAGVPIKITEAPKPPGQPQPGQEGQGGG